MSPEPRLPGAVQRIGGSAILAVILSFALHSTGSASGRPLLTVTKRGLAANPCGRRRTAPRTYRHIVWIVMENKDYSQVIGSSDAPYINGLARKCGLATSFSAESHPSVPNYIAMTSGSTQGISGDPDPSDSPLGVKSIFSQLGTHWRALEESMSSNCEGSSDGLYDVNHNPAAYYTTIAHQCQRQDVPLGRRPKLSARFTFVTPNICHDMHTCDGAGGDISALVRSGDRWLSSWVPGILRSGEYRSGSTAVFITWDENDPSANGRVPTIVISPYTTPGSKSARAFTHYSLLRTTEDLLGIRRHLGQAASAASMRAPFHL